MGIPPNAVKIMDGKIVDGKGKPVAIKGLSWFGFNNGATMVDGLWAGGFQAATDFAMIVYQLQLFGFNAIRLPFTFDNLELPAKAQDRNCQFTRDEALKTRVLDPLLADSEQQAPPEPELAPRMRAARPAGCPAARPTGRHLPCTPPYSASGGGAWRPAAVPASARCPHQPAN